MHRRAFILLLCLIVIAVVTVLAASLHDVQFQPGRSFGGAAAQQTPDSLTALQIAPDTPIWKILLLWLAFVVNLALFFFLLPPEARKRILRQIVSFALGVLALLMALRYRVIQLPELFARQAESASPGSPQLPSSGEVPTFQRPEVAPWITYLISLAALWVVVILVWLLYRWWRRLRAGQNGSLAGIAVIARTSLEDLAAGRQWGDVVIEAYARMSDTVRLRRGLQRGAATTAREFASRLTGAGLPSDSVAGLTRLFESVRYGERASSEQDTREAIACLESILRACGANP